MHILIISEDHLIRTFLLPVIKQLKKEYRVTFDCFIINDINNQKAQSLSEDFGQVFTNPYPKGFLKQIPKIRFFATVYGLWKVSGSLPKYDIAHINFHHYYLAALVPRIRQRTTRLYVTFFGSDFNQAAWYRHLCNRFTVKRSEGIFTTNPTLLRQIVQKYKLASLSLVKDTLFPLLESFITFSEFLESHTREQAKEVFNTKKKILVCGYNASPITNHEYIINALVKSKNYLKDYKIIFPMTYGTRAEETRNMVKEAMSQSSLDFLILDQYLSLTQLHHLRLAADIFISVPARDQMSASMLEHLAAGSVVITGKWLPYETLLENGINLYLIDNQLQLADTVKTAIENLEEYQDASVKNRDLVMKMTDWDHIKEKWLQYYYLDQEV